MTSVGSSLSSNQATGVSKSRGLARPLEPIGPSSGRRSGSAMILGDIAARFAVDFDPEFHAARDQRRPSRARTSIRPNSVSNLQRALLRDDQQLAVGIDEHAADPSIFVAR